jgi:hypothetical protein
MSNPTSNFNWQMPTATDLVTDLPADFEVFGQAVDSSMADLLGGTTGQVLKKNTDTDMDFVWGTVAGDIEGVSVTSPITGGGTSGTVTIGIDSTAVVPSQTGNSGKYLTTNGTSSSWGIVSSGASVQVVGATTSTTVSTTSATYVDSGLTVTITPTSASNKVMLFVSSAFDFERAASSYSAAIRLYRSATGLTGDVINNQVNQGSGSETGGASQFNLIYLDSPATTSATTYKIQMRGSGGTQVRSQSNSTIGSIIAMEVTP